MKQYFKKNYILVLLLLSTLLACEKEANVPLAQQIVQENVNAYRQKRQLECRQKVWERADIIVDSMLLEYARNTIMSQDSIIVPTKPDRPNKPIQRSALDTTPVKPLF